MNKKEWFLDQEKSNRLIKLRQELNGLKGVCQNQILQKEYKIKREIREILDA